MSESAPEPTKSERRLSSTEVLLLTLACSVVTANAYYIHPIISEVARSFDVGHGLIGIVPGANQIALALGVFLILPLGDRISNRKLVTVTVTGQFLSITGMAFAQDFRLFTLASTVLGFFTIAPYLLPTYASKRIDPARLGAVTAMLTTGIIGGILVARAGAGIVAELFGWRTVYYIAASFMLVVSILLPFLMDEREAGHDTQPKQGYFSLLLSMAGLVKRYPEILLSGTIQGLGFGVFLSVWMGLGLHLPDMGYGVDVVGYLAAFSILNLFTTPWLGRLADNIGPYKSRMIFASVNLIGVLLLWPMGHSVWLLIVPVMLMTLVGPAVDITNRMTFLSLAPEIRTRLMTVYIVMMFIGGGISSSAGTAVYDLAGWAGNAVLAGVMSATLVVLCGVAWAWRGRATE
ncbi:MFS transporter [Henriciella aquimarina]|uniref:MFS transporter n=1 Tax=Henriciella aquimarina TaxID=545261 RepID=UPI000A05EC30|nr:MFS transporter [Henriciella aquimarina]